MSYLVSSIKEAESMPNKSLRQALKAAGVYEVKKWDRASLVSTWLAKFGTKELDGWDVCQCEHDRDSHQGNCNALTMKRMARCSCPQFVKA